MMHFKLRIYFFFLKKPNNHSTFFNIIKEIYLKKCYPRFEF